ncbi:MAG TPA: YbaK/EbsC family protein [Thermoanaerobaculia bacterium]|jgi:prolyl-tRNA editing enzyme YbaK/EbsC (Cys-tRNA(Pro) deacylase)
MHPNAERVQAELRARGAGGEVVELAASTRTSQEAAAAIGTTVAQIAKSLVFLIGETPVLVIASGVNRVSLDKLSKLLGGPAVRPDADTVKRLTGFPIGGVAPVGHASRMRVLIDQDLLRYDEVWAAAGTPNAVFRTTPDELARISEGEVVDLREEPAPRSAL